jgi:ABC-type multidrug transport system ATPase subunit
MVPASQAQILLNGEPCPNVVPLLKGKTFSVGRDTSAGISLQGDQSVSGKAAILEFRSGGWVIRRTGSSDIRVNGSLMQDQVELVIGDLIQLGRFCFRFRGNHLRLTDGRGAALTVRGLTRSVWSREVPGTKIRILDQAWLDAPPNSFVGLLGPSGHGKSTLLNAMSGMVRPDSGVVLIDGSDFLADPAAFSSEIGYVPQDDIVHEQLTVEQALSYSARLRLPAKTPTSEIRKLVHSVAARVGLAQHINKRIKESTGGGLSGGQRKRVSVAVELLGSPRLLLMDEPTSGLDPATETMLMELFRDLADQGCTIICTTHVLENAFLMNHIALIVMGSIDFAGSSHDAPAHYGASKLTDMYVELYRIAEERRAEVRKTVGDPENRSLSQWLEWLKLKMEAWPKQLRSQWEDASRVARQIKAIQKGQIGSVFSQAATKLRSPLSVLRVLLERRWMILNSDWKNLGLLAIQPVIVGLALGMFVDAVEPKAFLAHLTTLWLGCNNSAQEIVKELPIFRRERFVGLGIGVYVASKFIFGAFSTLLQAGLIFACLHLFGTGWEGNVPLQILCLTLTALAANSIGLAISACSRSAEQALFIVPLFLIPQILFSGFVVPLDAWQKDKNTSKPKDQPILQAVRWMPGYASQRITDTSMYWGETIPSPLSSPPKHRIAMSNLHADRYVVWGSKFENQRPIWGGGAKLFLFIVLGLRLACWRLKVGPGG